MILPHPISLLIKERGNQEKVMAFGTFDIFHLGHKSYLKQARELGDELIVVVARDETVEKVKGNSSRNNELRRLKKVKENQLQDKVVLGSLENKYEILKKYRPDIIALGYDQKVDIDELKNKLSEFNVNTEIVRLNSYKPEIYKSSKLKAQ